MAYKVLIIGILASFTVSFTAQAHSPESPKEKSASNPKTEGGVKPVKPPKSKSEIRRSLEEINKDQLKTCLPGDKSSLILSESKNPPEKSLTKEPKSPKARAVRPNKLDHEAINSIADGIIYDENFARSALDPDATCSCIIGGPDDKKDFLAAVGQEILTAVQEDPAIQRAFPEVNETTIRLLPEMGPHAWRKKFRVANVPRPTSNKDVFQNDVPLVFDGAKSPGSKPIVKSSGVK